MSGEAIEVEIALNGRGAEASFRGERVEASSPAELWNKLGAVAGEGQLHLLPRGARSLRSERATAPISAQHAGGSIGRVRYASGAISPLLQRTELLHYLDVPAGSLVVGAWALASCASRVPREWDRQWSHDLALALSRDRIVAVTNEVVAEVGGTEPNSSRLPLRRAGLTRPDDPTAPFILIYGRITASTSLYFEGVPADIAARLRFLEPGDLFSDMPWLCAADLVVVVRGFEHALVTGAVDLLEEIGTPMLWFTDDDFMALAHEAPSLGYYTSDAVRSFARRMSGIGVTSKNLADTLSGYHENVLAFPCVLDRDLWLKRPAVAASPPRGAAFGGAFRRPSFVSDVLPAARATGLDVYAGSNLARGQIGVRTIGARSDFRQFVLEWQRLAPMVVLHPYGETANIANKSLGSILTVAYLGAVPIVGHEPAYADVGEAEGVLKAGPDTGSWREQIARTLDEKARAELAAAFRRWVEASFDPTLARPAFAALSKLAAAGGEDAAAARLDAALGSRTLQRALPRQPAWRRHLVRLRTSLERRLAGLRRG
jgi:hypothetical protein